MNDPATRRGLLAMWGVVGLLLAVLLAFTWQPLTVAWKCYWLHENAAREQAQVVGKLEESGRFALHIEEGPHAGSSCTAGTSWQIFEATQEGDRLEVVYVEWKPGECELVSTIEASALVLWSFVALLAFVGLFIVGVGLFLHRSFTRPGVPARRLPAEPRDVRCPACGKGMDEGYLPLVAGLSWRAPGEPVGLPHALRGLPGTVGWRGRPLLHAFRCVPCEVVTLQYGDAKR